MSKIAIVTDSNSGISQEEGKALGIAIVPMPFFIDDETYYEGINLSQPEFYEHLKSGVDISTSQPTPDSIMKLWDELLQDYDEIVHIPMSSGLSGSFQTANMLSSEDEYEGKVQVVNNQRVSVTQKQSALDAKELAEHGKSALEIKEILEKEKFNSSIYIMLDTLYYLKKGGRITPAAATLGTILRIKPVLQIQGEKLDAFAKARTVNQGKNIMVTALKNDVINRMQGLKQTDDVWIEIAHTQNEEAANQLRDELLEIFPGYHIVVDALSLSIACHIGPGSLAVACSKRISY
ncbi:MAG: DegV family protein [Lachnospiraceae bacterium]|nr:DegV family protein [Lachnospiraceae bacterium]